MNAEEECLERFGLNPAFGSVKSVTLRPPCGVFSSTAPTACAWLCSRAHVWRSEPRE